jgi:hypothetical protein
MPGLDLIMQIWFYFRVRVQIYLQMQIRIFIEFGKRIRI